MMYAQAEDREVLAAEYVLGTLDADERVQAQALMILDPDFAVTVQGWERRLGALHVMLPPVEPPGESWARIKAQLARTERIEEIFLPEVDRPPLAKPSAGVGAIPVASDEVETARRRMRAWRRLALLLLVVCLFGGTLLALQATRPDLLLAALRLAS